MKLLAWNIQAGGGRRAPQIAATIEMVGPDIVALSEARSTSTELLARLEDLGYEWQHLRPGLPRCGHAALASRVPLEVHDRTPFGEAFPGRWIEAGVPKLGATVVALYGPLKGEDYNAFWNHARSELIGRTNEPLVVAGDFNTGASRLDAPGGTFFCSQHFVALSEECGLADAWRHVHGDLREFSYHHRSGVGVSKFRIDHAFVSRSMVERLSTACYLHEVREAGVSDHAPLLVEFTVPAAG